MSVDSMAGWALETGLAVSALIFVILLIRRPVAQYFSASAAYALWALPFIRLCLPEITLPALSFLPKSFLSGKNPGGALSELTPIEVLTPVSADFYPIVLDSVALTRVNPTSYVAELLIAIWLMGAAAWLVYCFMRQRHFMKTLQQNTQAPSQTFITQLAEPTSRMAKLKNLPVIRIASDETGPLVTGLLRPVVVLPTGFTERLTARQQQFALLHEFTHIRRADLWVACAWLLFRALNWPNPLVHIAARHFRSDQEAACDATVLAQIGDDPQNRHSYGETLLCSVKLTQGTRTHQYMHQPLKLALNHSLKERLMVLKSTQSVSRPVARLWATGVIAGGLALSAPYTFADGSSDELAGEAKTEKRQVIRKRKIIKGDGDVEKEERPPY